MAKRNKPSRKEIQRGESTHTQGQVMFPVSLRVTKTMVRTPEVPTPPEEELFDISSLSNLRRIFKPEEFINVKPDAVVDGSQNGILTWAVIVFESADVAVFHPFFDGSLKNQPSVWYHH
jgi:hypothetical protein